MFFEHDFKSNPELTNSQLEVFQFSSPHKQIVEDFDAVVVKVHDADTVTLKTDFRDFDFPLRVADIDAPELSEGGDAAADYLRTWLLGRSVRVLIDVSNRVGKYGRLIGRLFVDGLDVSNTLVSIGLVKPFGYKKEGEVPDFHKTFRLEQWV